MAKIKYTCIVDTTYTLFLYLLYQNQEDIERTMFFVGDAISDDIAAQLPNCVKISTNKEDYEGKENLWRIRWNLFWKYHLAICCTKIYAQDHLRFSSQLICGLKYTLLEDGPRTFTANKDNDIFRKRPPLDLKTTLWIKIFIGTIHGYEFGRNRQCVNRIISSAEDISSPLIAGKKYELVDRNLLWGKNSKQEKDYIMRVFNITNETLKIAKNAHTIFFSQPLITDCGLTEDEHLSIILPYYERWKIDGFVIKPHPRDKFDYKKHFPDAIIMNCKAPMQLLNTMGLAFKRAITVSSTAVSDLPPETELIWIGNEINPKLVRALGVSTFIRRQNII